MHISYLLDLMFGLNSIPCLLDNVNNTALLAVLKGCCLESSGVQSNVCLKKGDFFALC